MASRLTNPLAITETGQPVLPDKYDRRVHGKQLTCPDCKQPLTFVNHQQTRHFRHLPSDAVGQGQRVPCTTSETTRHRAAKCIVATHHARLVFQLRGGERASLRGVARAIQEHPVAAGQTTYRVDVALLDTAGAVVAVVEVWAAHRTDYASKGRDLLSHVGPAVFEIKATELIEVWATACERDDTNGPLVLRDFARDDAPVPRTIRCRPGVDEAAAGEARRAEETDRRLVIGQAEALPILEDVANRPGAYRLAVGSHPVGRLLWTPLGLVRVQRHSPGTTWYGLWQTPPLECVLHLSQHGAEAVVRMAATASPLLQHSLVPGVSVDEGGFAHTVAADADTKWLSANATAIPVGRGWSAPRWRLPALAPPPDPALSAGVWEGAVAGAAPLANHLYQPPALQELFRHCSDRRCAWVRAGLPAAARSSAKIVVSRQEHKSDPAVFVVITQDALVLGYQMSYKVRLETAPSQRLPWVTTRFLRPGSTDCIFWAASHEALRHKGGHGAVLSSKVLELADIARTHSAIVSASFKERVNQLRLDLLGGVALTPRAEAVSVERPADRKLASADEKRSFFARFAQAPSTSQRASLLGPHKKRPITAIGASAAPAAKRPSTDRSSQPTA